MNFQMIMQRMNQFMQRYGNQNRIAQNLYQKFQNNQIEDIYKFGRNLYGTDFDKKVEEYKEQQIKKYHLN